VDDDRSLAEKGKKKRTEKGYLYKTPYTVKTFTDKELGEDDTLVPGETIGLTDQLYSVSVIGGPVDKGLSVMVSQLSDGKPETGGSYLTIAMNFLDMAEKHYPMTGWAVAAKEMQEVGRAILMAGKGGPVACTDDNCICNECNSNDGGGTDDGEERDPKKLN